MIPGLFVSQGMARRPRDEVIFMDFEGADEETANFRDEGRARSIWVRDAAGGAKLDNAQILHGRTSLYVPTMQSNYIETDLTSANGLPATGDWDLKISMRAPQWTIGGVGRTFVSAQDTTATAAGTQFAVASSSTSKLVFILSNGTTRSTICTSTNNIPINSTVEMEWQRRGNTVNQYINGALDGTGAFSGSICQPASRKIRLGKPELAVVSGFEMWFDNFRIRRY